VRFRAKSGKVKDPSYECCWIPSGAEVNTDHRRNGRTALLIAMWHNQIPIVRLKGPEVDQAERSGTAVHITCKHVNESIANLLPGHHVDFQSKTDSIEETSFGRKTTGARLYAVARQHNKEWFTNEF
jgi:hypothetical protein